MSYWYDSIAVGVLGKMRYSAILYANTDRQKYELLRIVIWSTVAEFYPMRLGLNFNKPPKFFHFSTFSFIRLFNYILEFNCFERFGENVSKSALAFTSRPQSCSVLLSSGDWVQDQSPFSHNCNTGHFNAVYRKNSYWKSLTISLTIPSKDQGTGCVRHIVSVLDQSSKWLNESGVSWRAISR